MFVKGGYLEVQTHAITVLADRAVRAKDLDEKTALEAEKAPRKRWRKGRPGKRSPPPRSLSNAVASSRRSASCATAPDPWGRAASAATGAAL